MDWSYIGTAVGGALFGAFSGWAKKSKAAKKTVDTLEGVADTAAQAAINGMAAHIQSVTDQLLAEIEHKLGPGTPLDELQLKRDAAIARGKALAITEFRKRFAEARAATIPSTERDTKPERVVPGAGP